MKLTPWEPDIRSLVDRIDLGDIDLQPDFQRQEVWSTAKKRRLIDTVIRGWSIPPVHLVVTENNKLEVLDGQQRLAALRDFLGGRFSIDGRITPHDPIVAGLHGRFYKKLDDSVRRTIDHYPLRCFRISDYSPEEPSELFYRLNQPTMLTAGEQRNALYGPARVQLKSLVAEFVDAGNTKDSIGFSNVRLAYDDIIARLLYFIEAGSFGLKGTESRISERFRSRAGFPDDVTSRASRAIELFSEARDYAAGARFNKASLLSWLLFYCRFTDQLPDRGFLGWYQKEATLGRHVNAIPAMKLFEDRSSLRVTDVSSVVYRDVVLWYLYSKVRDLPCPGAIPVERLDALDALYQRNEFNFEEAAAEVINQEAWSGTL